MSLIAEMEPNLNWPIASRRSDYGRLFIDSITTEHKYFNRDERDLRLDFLLLELL